MKIVETHDILSVGMFSKSEEWRIACRQVKDAISAVDWPHGSRSFTVYPQGGKKRGDGNRVNSIKKPCIEYLEKSGWLTEKPRLLKKGIMSPRNLDALYIYKAGYIGFKWGFGNITSSHRAINKLLLTIQTGGLLGGFLVVPSDNLKTFLTDRIGNIEELRPFLPLWRSIPIKESVLRIEVVEHDATSPDMPRIGIS
jgi:hypothetical protein